MENISRKVEFNFHLHLPAASHSCRRSKKGKNLFRTNMKKKMKGGNSQWNYDLQSIVHAPHELDDTTTQWQILVKYKCKKVSIWNLLHESHLKNANLTNAYWIRDNSQHRCAWNLNSNFTRNMGKWEKLLSIPYSLVTSNSLSQHKSILISTLCPLSTLIQAFNLYIFPFAY